MQVYGISTDDVRTQASFHEKQKLNFGLLSDANGSVARAYGVLHRRGFARRVTFVIDDKGVVRHIAPKVNVREHGAELAQTIRALQKN